MSLSRSARRWARGTRTRIRRESRSGPGGPRSRLRLMRMRGTSRALADSLGCLLFRQPNLFLITFSFFFGFLSYLFSNSLYSAPTLVLLSLVTYCLQLPRGCRCSPFNCIDGWVGVTKKSIRREGIIAAFGKGAGGSVCACVYRMYDTLQEP